MKALDPSLDYVKFLISKERSLKLEVKPPVQSTLESTFKNFSNLISLSAADKY